MTPTPELSALHRSLLAATRTHPLERKLLICPSHGAGVELLRSLAVAGEAWVGWEVTTPGALALELAGAAVSAEGLGVVDAFEEQARVEAALDAVLGDGTEDPVMRPMAEGSGFRDAVLNAVQALRLAGVAPEDVEGAGVEDERKRIVLGAVLARHEAALAADGRTDAAGVFRRAVEGIQRGYVALPDARLFLLPGLSRRGLPGRLLTALLERGAKMLLADPVRGLEPPGTLWREAEPESRLSWLHAVAEAPPPDAAEPAEIELFSAASPSDELREVLRRIMASGLRWDEAEIVASDPAVYGSALHALSQRLEIPVSYAVGLPVERTRPGRAAAAWLRWVEAGHPSAGLREMLASGDLEPPAGAPSGAALARRLRSLRIGWGRERHLERLAAARAAAARRSARLDEDADADESAAPWIEREQREIEALDALLRPILEAAPAAPPRPGERSARVAPADFARGLLALIERVPTATGPDAVARQRLESRLRRVAETLRRPGTHAAAVATVRRHIAVRVPARSESGSAPWSSAGGHLHLTDLEHGGLTGRRLAFVVGLDAGRFPGAGLQDPLLLDADRRALAADALPGSAERLRATLFRLAALLARLRGRVTLSYSAWSPGDARTVAPAAALLEAYRLRTDADASFDRLHEAIGQPACAVPRRVGRLDDTDAWLGALSHDGVLLRGEAAVRSVFRGLDAGLTAAEALRGDVATPYHGRLRPRPELDPRTNRELVLSATRLEGLGACPLRFFYRDVLRLRPPEEVAREPDRWLDALKRGRLLHAVYERSLREARRRELEHGDDAFLALALETVDAVAAEMRRETPPPSEAVYLSELGRLREDARCFVGMVRERGAEWIELERSFGMDGEEPLDIQLGGGTLRLRGTIDRVDAHGDRLVVVDYKTGSPGRYTRKSGVYNGGRRLQHVLYAQAAGQRLGRPVERFEYHFPTRTGENTVRSYSIDGLARGLELVDRMLDAVAQGRFLPTENADDCGYCDFREVCHVRPSLFGPPDSPRSEWAARHFAELDDFDVLRAVRRWETA